MWFFKLFKLLIASLVALTLAIILFLSFHILFLKLLLFYLIFFRISMSFVKCFYSSNLCFFIYPFMLNFIIVNIFRLARLQYYYDNIDIRKKNSNEYWALHGHKYLEQRSKNNELEFKHWNVTIIYTVKDQSIIIKIIISNLYLKRILLLVFLLTTAHKYYMF